MRATEKRKRLWKVMFNMKKIIFLLIFFVMVWSGISQNSRKLKKPDYIIDDKRIFLEAQIAFDEKNYSETLKLLDDARISRKNKVDWEVDTLKNSFKPAEVKIMGDDLNDIVKVLQDRQDYDAIEIINYYKRILTLEFFDFSAQKLISFIENNREFPEADFLAGKVYQLEGEYEVAQKLYLQAFDFASILYIPDEKFDILYALSEIALVQKDFNKYEEELLLIVSCDKAFNDKPLLQAMMRTIKSKKKKDIEKFFVMYRAENIKFLKAYFSLAEYYSQKNENERALTMSALGSLTGFSKIYDVTKDRNPDFFYKNLSGLLQEASQYADIVEWGKENDIWKGFNNFAKSADNNKCKVFAKELYSILKDFSPEEYWRTQAEIEWEKF